MDDCSAVVMDEFHCFNDMERGIVWELSLGMLPKPVRLMLLSATNGNAYEFVSWLGRAHDRRIQLVQGTERKVPLSFEWVDDAFLDEHLERIAEGDDSRRRTPSLVFCFNRDECWQVAELSRGKSLSTNNAKPNCRRDLRDTTFPEGAGPKLKAVLQRGIGIHHAGLLSKYRRVVEELYQTKLFERLCLYRNAFGRNQLAGSIGRAADDSQRPTRKTQMIEPSSAHQNFRPRRPSAIRYPRLCLRFGSRRRRQVSALEREVRFNSRGYERSGLLRAKKQLKKKMPKRRDGETYWTAGQFETLRNAAPASSKVAGCCLGVCWPIFSVKTPKSNRYGSWSGNACWNAMKLKRAQRELNQMLITLWTADYGAARPKADPHRTGQRQEKKKSKPRFFSGSTQKPGKNISCFHRPPPQLQATRSFPSRPFFWERDRG